MIYDWLGAKQSGSRHAYWLGSAGIFKTRTIHRWAVIPTGGNALVHLPTQSHAMSLLCADYAQDYNIARMDASGVVITLRYGEHAFVVEEGTLYSGTR